MSKIYMVCGLYDASCGNDSILDADPYIKCFATEQEANQACTIVNEFYWEKCKIHCAFEVREIDLDNLCTIKKLKKELDKEYNECWKED